MTVPIAHPHHISQLSVRQTLELAQHEQFAKPIRQVAHRARDQRGVIGSKQQRFRIRCRSSAAVSLFIEGVGFCLHAVAAPVETGIANNREEPGTPISAGKCSKVPKGPQRCLLHDIFRVVLIPHQPARQPLGVIEMGKDNVVKTLTGLPVDRLRYSWSAPMTCWSPCSRVGYWKRNPIPRSRMFEKTASAWMYSARTGSTTSRVAAAGMQPHA